MCNPMGCGTSSESVNNTENASPQPSDYYDEDAVAPTTMMSVSGVNLHSKQTVVDAYLRLDDEILRLEEQCPGPRLVTIEAWIKYLESRQSVLTNDIIQLPLHMLDEDFDEEEELTKYSRRTRLENDVESLAKVRQLTESLNVVTDVTQAVKYEEFLANVSRRYIENCSEVLREDILEHAHKRANQLRELWAKLRTKYNELDALLASVSENRYSNPNEQLIDAELEVCRQIRDKLGGTVEQWRTSANLLSTSAKSALVAKEHYDLIQTASTIKDKIAAASDCRNSVLGAIIAFRCAQEALPQVDIQHITNRQTVAVGHANEYLFTDIANPDRYVHTKYVLDAFHAGLTKSNIWLHETFQTTLKKELEEAENDIKELAGKLREIRSDYIRIKAGDRMYVPPEQGQSE